jgi:L-asparagine transporter-like permease
LATTFRVAGPVTKCSDRQSASVGIVVILLSAKFPNLPTILFTSCGATVLLLYMVIAITHLANRYRNRHAEDQLEVKMWLFPYLTIATIHLHRIRLDVNGFHRRAPH